MAGLRTDESYSRYKTEYLTAKAFIEDPDLEKRHIEALRERDKAEMEHKDMEARRENQIQNLNDMITDGTVTRVLVNESQFLESMESFWGPALNSALEGPNPEVVDWILDRRVDVNIKNYQGDTALFSSWRDLDVICRLVESGAKLNVRNKAGKTALLEFCDDEYSSTERTAKLDKAVIQLVKLGADTETEDSTGHTIFEVAAYRGRFELIRYFLDTLRPSLELATRAMKQSERDHPSSPEAARGREEVNELLSKYVANLSTTHSSQQKNVDQRPSKGEIATAMSVLDLRYHLAQLPEADMAGLIEAQDLGNGAGVYSGFSKAFGNLNSIHFLTNAPDCRSLLEFDSGHRVQVGKGSFCSILTFGYTGQGPSSFSSFLRQAGFSNPDTEGIQAPRKMFMGGTSIGGQISNRIVEWEDGSKTEIPGDVSL